jgi:hypothetical protein
LKKLQHLAEYAMLRVAVGILTRIPPHVADTIGAKLGSLGYSPFRIRRAVVDDNLKRAFPEKDEAWRANVARKSYEHLGREMIAMLRLSKLSREEILKQTSYEDTDDADTLFRSKGRGGVIVVGLVDNVIKPLLIKRGMEIHGGVVFFSLLGGIATFGAIGLIIGPLAVSMFLALIAMYHRDYSPNKTSEPEIPGISTSPEEPPAPESPPRE